MGIETAILGGAGIGAVGSILGGREARKGANAGADTQWRMYQDQVRRQQPFYDMGLDAAERYRDELFSPNYIQNMSRSGINALDSSAAARGLYGSTGHLSDIANYVGQNVQGDRLNRLASLAGYGPSSASSMNATSQATGNNLSNLAQAAGNARASSYMGLANTANNALSQYAMGSYLQNAGRPLSSFFG